MSAITMHERLVYRKTLFDIYRKQYVVYGGNHGNFEDREVGIENGLIKLCKRDPGFYRGCMRGAFVEYMELTKHKL
jgi:hypothetical protein